MDPDRNFDAFARIRAADEEVHSHSSATYFWDNNQRSRDVWDVLTIQVTLAGTGSYRDDQGERPVPAGFGMLFSHHEPTAYGYPKDTREPYRLRFMQLWPAPTIDSLVAQLRRNFGSVLGVPDGSGSAALFNEVFNRYKLRTFRDRFHESELIHRFLIALYREQVQETKTSDPIEYGYHCLRNHFRSPINLKTVAAKCSVSREHFIRQFSRRYGEPPGTMLRRLRFEHAHAMLAATQQTVEEVALASGFASADTFGRAYRQHYGHSPRSQGPG
ncbi:MAG: helix-turn-helix domain-containing protein [Opitutaceae bacterium]